MALTTLLTKQIVELSLKDLSSVAIHRSKRMILDTIGVGVLGSHTSIAQILRSVASETEGCNQRAKSLVWGTKSLKISSPMAAYLNGCSIHAMDFDDTWQPATHPSGPVLPAVLSLVDALQDSSLNLQDVLVAFNIGVQVQGALLRCSSAARNIPNRFHPPAVVGVLGSAAACSRLLGLSQKKCVHALAISSSFAGAPMSNAGTMTKSLHSGNAARFGLEAALLADKGVEGSETILDEVSGFGAYYDDYKPQDAIDTMQNSENVFLHESDVAFKLYPCHFAMNWGIDASLKIRAKLLKSGREIEDKNVKMVKITAPKSKYINRQIPTNEHEARHSFQFTVCSALLDGHINQETFQINNVQREDVRRLLNITIIETPNDMKPSLNELYVKVQVFCNDGSTHESTCLTPYGHWRFPLTDEDLQKKYYQNTKVLGSLKSNEIVNLVNEMSQNVPANVLISLLCQ